MSDTEKLIAQARRHAGPPLHMKWLDDLADALAAAEVREQQLTAERDSECAAAWTLAKECADFFADAEKAEAEVERLTAERDERLTLEESRTLAFKVTDLEAEVERLTEALRWIGLHEPVRDEHEPCDWRCVRSLVDRARFALGAGGSGRTRSSQ